MKLFSDLRGSSFADCGDRAECGCARGRRVGLNRPRRMVVDGGVCRLLKIRSGSAATGAVVKFRITNGTARRVNQILARRRAQPSRTSPAPSNPIVAGSGTPAAGALSSDTVARSVPPTERHKMQPVEKP